VNVLRPANVASAPGGAATAKPRHIAKGGLATLVLGAIGVVQGNIGTTPLYALNQLFFGRAGPPLTPDNVLGGISLVIWTITVIVSIKYAALVLRAQNEGEGGVFALYGLLHEHRRRGTRLLLWSLMIGAGLLFGDGVITPSISVLSAVEGLHVAAPALSEAVIPLTILLLTVLFAIQSRGTAGIGRVFGPLVLAWFAAIAVLGAAQIAREPAILAAFNPLLGLSFLGRTRPFETLFVLGALMLVVTGGEAMYADLGHFGARPIRLSWFAVAFPALVLNYLGQGAYLLSGGPVAEGNLFFSLIPPVLLYPMVLLATAATVVASQSLISGAFTLASQAVRLGLFPRLAIRHTHEAHAGQIYLPFINWSLYVGCVLLVVLFGSSSALGAAYGLAVAGVMLITSLAMVPIARLHWHWDRARTALVWGSLSLINLCFLLASTLKFLEGGFVPVTIGVVLFLVMITWRWGRKATFAAYSAHPAMTMAELIALHRRCSVFMERNAILMAPKPVRRPGDRGPALLRLLWERYGILPRNLIFVEITHLKTPYIHDERCHVTVFDRDPARGSIIAVEMRFGFMEEPNVERTLEEMARHKEIELPTDRHQWVVHVSHEHLLPSRTMGPMKRVGFRLFVLLRRVSQPAYYYYGLGDEVRLSAEIMPVRVR
jgi:KUP system potassium uptake protein